MNSCPDSELEVERFMQTFHDHGILVTEGVAEEWSSRRMAEGR